MGSCKPQVPNFKFVFVPPRFPVQSDQPGSQTSLSFSLPGSHRLGYMSTTKMIFYLNKRNPITVALFHPTFDLKHWFFRPASDVVFPMIRQGHESVYWHVCLVLLLLLYVLLHPNWAENCNLQQETDIWEQARQGFSPRKHCSTTVLHFSLPDFFVLRVLVEILPILVAWKW